METLQSQFAIMKTEMDGFEAEVTARVCAKLVHDAGKRLFGILRKKLTLTRGG